MGVSDFVRRGLALTVPIPGMTWKGFLLETTTTNTAETEHEPRIQRRREEWYLRPQRPLPIVAILPWPTEDTNRASTGKLNVSHNRWEKISKEWSRKSSLRSNRCSYGWNTFVYIFSGGLFQLADGFLYKKQEAERNCATRTFWFPVQVLHSAAVP